MSCVICGWIMVYFYYDKSYQCANCKGKIESFVLVGVKGNSYIGNGTFNRKLYIL